MPRKQPKRGRPWLNEASCIRLRAARPNHVWSYDFVHARTEDGLPLKLLTTMDEATRECLCIDVAPRIRSEYVLYRFRRLMPERGVPDHVRSDNGPEFVAEVLRAWLERVGTRTLLIEPGSPWENGYIESFNGKLRDERLNGSLFYTLGGAKAVIEAWRHEYNHVRPHSSLEYRPPAPEALMPLAGSAEALAGTISGRGLT